MKQKDLVGALFWLALGILLCLWSSIYEIWAMGKPGSGFFPFLMGVLLILLSLILLVQAKKLRSPAEKVTSSFVSGGWKRVTAALLILASSAFLFNPLGCTLTVFFLVIAYMRGVGSQGWKATLLAAFFSALGVHLLFILLLKQPLPRGFLRI